MAPYQPKAKQNSQQPNAGDDFLSSDQRASYPDPDPDPDPNPNLNPTNRRYTPQTYNNNHPHTPQSSYGHPGPRSSLFAGIGSWATPTTHTPDHLDQAASNANSIPRPAVENNSSPYEGQDYLADIHAQYQTQTQTSNLLTTSPQQMYPSAQTQSSRNTYIGSASSARSLAMERFLGQKAEEEPFSGLKGGDERRED
ncbi:MAG: hypothetical protein MMC33_008530 [Icmadophila ericetorum]|nr:hypothetical protein [Icmadophila ericetorum]